MIREVSKCPYCHSVVAVDDDGPELLFDPDRPADAPCRHMALASVALQVYKVVSASGCPDDGPLLEERTGLWLYARDAGLRRLPAKFDPFVDYVEHLMVDLLPPDDRPRGFKFKAVGGTAGDREERRTGSGMYFLEDEDGAPLGVIFDAFGVYSRTPDALVAGVRALAKDWAVGAEDE